jgi:hypothetical protein
MRNQQAASQEDDYIPPPHRPGFDSLDDEKIPGDKPRTHASANNAQNEMAALANSIKKLRRIEIRWAGHECVGCRSHSDSKNYGLAAVANLFASSLDASPSHYSASRSSITEAAPQGSSRKSPVVTALPSRETFTFQPPVIRR